MHGLRAGQTTNKRTVSKPILLLPNWNYLSFTSKEILGQLRPPHVALVFNIAVAMHFKLDIFLDAPSLRPPIFECPHPKKRGYIRPIHTIIYYTHFISFTFKSPSQSVSSLLSIHQAAVSAQMYDPWIRCFLQSESLIGSYFLPCRDLRSVNSESSVCTDAEFGSPKLVSALVSNKHVVLTHTLVTVICQLLNASKMNV